MSRTLTLQDFTQNVPVMQDFSAVAPGASQQANSHEAEDALASFDRGYQSGWDDCAAAEAEERRGISTEIARQLSEATLTYSAARRDVLAALGPFLDDVARTLLPSMAVSAVLPTIIQELGPLAESQTAKELEILTAPSLIATVQTYIDDEGFSGVEVRSEPTYAEGQASIREGSERKDIDLSAAAAKISEAIVGFRTQSDAGVEFSELLNRGAA